jgi:hypothetical protein
MIMLQDKGTKRIPYGFYPFWFWNGDMSELEIRWQIREMADKGVRGFFIHSRQGLQRPYLSESFFHRVQVAIEAAEELGLFVHLYDEYPYPSGVAGGGVTLGNPQFHATRLVQQAFDAPGGQLRKPLPRGSVLSCMAYPIKHEQVDWSRGIDLVDYVGMVLVDNSYNETGLTKYNQKRYFASNPTPVLETDVLKEPHRVFVSAQVLVDHHKYWDNFIDVLNPEAIRHFIRLTHERYFRRFGDRFGKSVHSIFVDETAPGWSARLPEAFRDEYGYDLLPLLPALQDRTHPQHLKVTFDLDRLRYKLFCQSFEEQVSGWCARHNLRYSGEKPSHRLSQLKYMDIPGCEPGHTKAGAPMDLLRPRIRQNARATASAAYFYGKEGSLCECFHSLGWSGTIQDAKIISEGLLLMGIRYLVPHGFFYTTHSLTKHDAPPTFFFQMPYWPLFGHLSKRLDRIAGHFESTYMDADILVVDPGSGLPSGSDIRDYERLLNILMEEHLDFLIVDTDILESGSFEDGRVHIRDVAADVVVLPNMRVVEEPLKAWLEVFEEAGGVVIRLEESFERDECAQILLENVEPRLHVHANQGDTAKLQIVTRTDGDRTLWFILNTGGEKVEAEFRTQHDVSLREITLEDGLPCMLTKTDGIYTRTIYPFESLMLEAAEEPSSEILPQRLSIPVNPPASVTLKSKNLLRMYNWQMELLDENGESLQTATVPAIPLPNQLAYGKFRFAPKINTFFGCTPEMRLPMLHINYRFQFESEFDGEIELVMEPGSIAGDWSVQVNESEPIVESDFGNTDAHVRGSLGLDITEYVRAGVNTIAAAVKTDLIDGGLINPLYLAGRFGVETRHAVSLLVEFRPDGGFEAWKENGLPYYAGVLEYETSFDLETVPEGENVLAEIEHGVPFQDATEVSINGGPWRPMPWSPYCILLPSCELREGSNALKIRVYTTLIRSFEGQWFDIEHHCYRGVEE